MTAYNVIVGDTVSRVLSQVPALEHSFFSSRTFAILASTFLVSLPLSLHR